MTSNSPYKTWKAICDVCGFEFQSDELKHRWDGLMVCHKDYETRHPQDFIKVRPERGAPPWTRPEPAEVFARYCSLIDVNAIPGIGLVGCSIVGEVNGFTS